MLYATSERALHWFQEKRIDSQNTHGTGCTLSAAIASYLAQGYTLSAAIEAAKTYLTKAIEMGKMQTIGKGRGPVDHFYFLRPQ